MVDHYSTCLCRRLCWCDWRVCWSRCWWFWCLEWTTSWSEADYIDCNVTLVITAANTFKLNLKYLYKKLINQFHFGSWKQNWNETLILSGWVQKYCGFRPKKRMTKVRTEVSSRPSSLPFSNENGLCHKYCAVVCLWKCCFIFYSPCIFHVVKSAFPHPPIGLLDFPILRISFDYSHRCSGLRYHYRTYGKKISCIVSRSSKMLKL